RLDALFNGTYEDLPEQQGMGPSRRFLPRSTQQRIADNSSPTIQQRLIDMKKNVRFGIDSGHQAAMHPLPVRSTSRYGETLSAPWLGHIGVWISLETLQPLLRNDLTDVEVLAVRIQICVTIIHELALGYSFTANIFGGFNTPMLSPTRSCGGPGLPPFGMFQASFFTWRALDYGQNKGHRRPASQLQSTRYDEIKAFLVANRAEQKLAIDNMEIISDAAFYRYIRDFGGIKLDIHEFKAFLSKCFENQELFIWCPFPNPGVVKRVPTGWPEPPVYVNERQLEDKNFIPDEKEREKLEYLLEEPRVQEKLYSSLKELRDLDINIFRDMFWVLKTSELMSKSDKALLIASEERFRDLVVSVAGAPDGSGIKSIVLGPKGIVRFAYPVDDYRDKYITPNMKSLLVLFEKTEMKWNAGWEANLKRKKERER
ncbi:hypothetical protein BKA65DRAFT_407294, partial [Rhexocercosporidium sp. MPI-PUGE-AT-0058]